MEDHANDILFPGRNLQVHRRVILSCGYAFRLIARTVSIKASQACHIVLSLPLTPNSPSDTVSVPLLSRPEQSDDSYYAHADYKGTWCEITSIMEAWTIQDVSSISILKGIRSIRLGRQDRLGQPSTSAQEIMPDRVTEALLPQLRVYIAFTRHK